MSAGRGGVTLPQSLLDHLEEGQDDAGAAGEDSPAAGDSPRGRGGGGQGGGGQVGGGSLGQGASHGGGQWGGYTVEETGNHWEVAGEREYHSCGIGNQ